MSVAGGIGIGAAAALTGLPAKTIRFYDEIGLVTATRARNGYRTFDPEQVARLSLLAACRDMGLEVEDYRAILSLRDPLPRETATAVAMEQIARLDAMAERLAGLRAALIGARDAGDDSTRRAALDDAPRES